MSISSIGSTAAQRYQPAPDDLIKSITADLKANNPEGAPELSETQLAEMATNIASGKRPQGTPQGPPPGDRAQSNRQDFMQMLNLGMPIDPSLVGGVNVDRYA